MHRSRTRLAFMAATLLVACTAQAQLFRAYLASYGSDANPCTLQQPCRLLPAALNAVATDGEIWMLDSANYNTGNVNVFKAVSILAAPGQVGSFISRSGGAALNFAVPGGKVALRNVVVANFATDPGAYGILVTDAGTVSIENAVFTGIPVQAVYAVGNGAQIHIKDAIFHDIGQQAVYAQDGPRVDIAGSQFLSTGGIDARSTTAATTTINLTDSAVAGGAGSASGVFASATAASAVAQVFVTRSSIQDTNTGLNANASSGGTATITLSGSTVAGNHQNVTIAGTGAVKSLGDNLVADPDIADSGSITPVTAR